MLKKCELLQRKYCQKCAGVRITVGNQNKLIHIFISGDNKKKFLKYAGARNSIEGQNKLIDIFIRLE